MKAFEVIDLHCDTIPAMMDAAERGEKLSLGKNELQIDLDKLERGGYLCQCFSLFTYLEELEEKGETPFGHVKKLAEFWQQEIGRYPDRIRQVRTYDELMENRAAGRISAVMTVEEGAVYEGKLDNLQRLYDMGVRMSTITWNFVNELGYPNPPKTEGQPWLPDRVNGLTETGIAFVQEMEHLGIVIDLSHLNDAGIDDVFRYTRGPVIASHSNVRQICGHLRNLSDDNIRRIAERGGVIGVNFYPAFLKEQEPGKCEASVMDIIRHIKYLKKLGGIDCIALGTDFDGYEGTIDIKDAGDIQLMADAMIREGFSDDEIEKVFSRNILRVFHEVW